MLGGLLLDNAAWDRIADLSCTRRLLSLRPSHHLRSDQPTDRRQQGRPTSITVFEALRNSDKAEEVGGLAYLNALAQNTPSAANIRRYAEIVRERAVLRRLVTVADEIATSAFNPAGRKSSRCSTKPRAACSASPRKARAAAGLHRDPAAADKGGRAYRGTVQAAPTRAT